MIWPYTLLVGLVLLTILLYCSAPRCPHCGSQKSERDQYLAWVRHCQACGSAYEVK
jgi:uncharacterized protein (DUF983 family)